MLILSERANAFIANGKIELRRGIHRKKCIQLLPLFIGGLKVELR